MDRATFAEGLRRLLEKLESGSDSVEVFGELKTLSDSEEWKDDLTAIEESRERIRAILHVDFDELLPDGSQEVRDAILRYHSEVVVPLGSRICGQLISDYLLRKVETWDG